MKLDGYEDPIVSSIRKYIAENQNPQAIKDDVKLWEARGYGGGLEYLLEISEWNEEKK